MGFKIGNVFNAVTNVAKNAKFKVKKYSPELLMAAGVVGMVGTVVVACRRTLKAQDILDEHADTMKNVHDAAEISEEYREMEMKKETVQVYLETGVKFVRLYAPVVGLGLLSVGCFVGSHRILKKRNIALIAAYNTVSEAFKRYRKRVVDELGEDADARFRIGKKAEEVFIKQLDKKTGEEKEVSKKVNTVDIPGDASEYGRWFTKGNTTQYEDPVHNIAYVKAQETYFNNLLQARGHVFLSEVYDALGFERTPASIVVGWVKGNGDDYIDFNIIDSVYCMSDKYNTAKNMKLYEEGFFLDFNVDGVIYDKI